MADAPDTTETEEWRDIPGWDGLYQASSLGRIKSLPRKVRIGQGRWRTTQERVMRPAETRGYLKLTLRRPAAEAVTHSVHHLVCEAFHGPRPPGCEVAHNDGTRNNNRPGNLRWASRPENALDRVKHGTSVRGENSCNATLTQHAVREIRRAVSEIISAAAEAQGVSYSTVADAVFRRTWKHVR